jgi:hypothetical protein
MADGIQSPLRAHFYRGECLFEDFGSNLERCMASDEATAALKADG